MKKTFAILISLVSLTLSLQAVAWPTKHKKPLQPAPTVTTEKADIEIFGEKLTLTQALQQVKNKMPNTIADILAGTKALPRDTTVFNWSIPGAVLYSGPAPSSNDKQITDYLHKYTDRYWQEETEGLYFAQDPYSSDYAGEVLLMTTIRAQTRYFTNAPETWDRKLSDAAIKELALENCPFTGIAQVLVLNLSAPQCATLSKLLAQAAQVKFLIYPYIKRNLPSFCRPHLGNIALIVFDDTAFIREETAVFDERYPTPQTFLSQQRILGAAYADKDRPLMAGLKSVLNRKIVPIAPEKFETWAKQSLFDCDWP